MEDLPNYILLEIFDHLDKLSLKALYKTCEKFRNLIENSSKLMRTFSLEVYENNIDHAIRSVMKAKHYSIKVHCRELRHCLTKLDKLFSPVSGCLVEVILVDLSADAAVHVFPYLSNVQKIKMNYEDQNVKESLIPRSFPNLKSLIMTGSCEPLRLIENHSIEKLTIGLSEEFMVSQVGVVNEFLKSCRNLKELTLKQHIPDIQKIDELPFNLTSLKIEQHSREPLADSFILPLIKKHKNSLKSISISCPNSMGAIIDYIVEFSQPDELHLELSDGNYHFPFMFNNTSVKKLSIKAVKTQTIPVDRFLAKFVNIETLDISGLEISFLMDRLVTISKLSKLKNLKIRSIAAKQLQSDGQPLKMNNLESLSISYINYDAQFATLISFFAFCPNLRSLSIKLMMTAEMNYSSINPKKLRNLLAPLSLIEKLHFGDGFVLNTEMVDVLLAHEDTLRQLRIDYDEQPIFDDVKENVKKFNETRIQCIIPKLNSDYDPFTIVSMGGFDENNPEEQRWSLEPLRDSSRFEL